MKRTMRVLYASVVLALSPLASAQTSTTQVDTIVTSLDATAAHRGQTQVAARIASSFTPLAGSEANALSLVNALRNGTNAMLTYAPPPTTTPPPPTTTTTTVTIDPPTGKMGWGNVKIALALAQDSLARAGITKPTAAQLQAALNGGDVTVKNADGATTTTTLKGILQMRASGMGWGQIAQSSGTKLGAVVSGLRTTHAKITALPVSTSTNAAAPATGIVRSKSLVSPSSKGIVTAAGIAPTAAQGKHAGNGASLGRGVVTAAGGSPSGGLATATSHGHGAGIVTASGGAATSVTTAQGAGGGNGNGKGKGNGKGAGG